MNFKQNILLYILVTVSICCINTAKAQIPACSSADTFIYYISGSVIYKYDPKKIITGTNPVATPIQVPPTAGGLAISDNINGATPSPTFYTVVKDSIHYCYDDTTWINTGHRMPGGGISAGGGNLFGFNGLTGEVYSYNGTGDASKIMTIPEFPGTNVGAIDCYADCYGDIYILRVPPLDTGGSFLRKYDVSGNLLQSWEVVRQGNQTPTGGMTIIGNYVYTDGVNGRCRGYISCGKFILERYDGPLIANDYASCNIPYTPGKAKANIKRHYLCPAINNVTVFSTAHNQGDIVSWKVIDGNATITTSCDTSEVQAATDATIVLTVSGLTACSQTTTDTVYITKVKASVNAGADRTPAGCYNFADTLQATLADTSAGLTYNLQWLPALPKTLQPAININTTTTYTLIVTTPLAQGGCSWRDSITVFADKQVKANITLADTNYCIGDTIFLDAGNSIVRPANLAVQYKWIYADGKIATQLKDTNIYSTHRRNSVKLVVTDTVGCSDTATAQWNVRNCDIWIPGVFSPNGDGRNDIFRLKGKITQDITSFEFLVFNRYGQKVFETTDANAGWDGSFKGAPCPMGTFFYYLRYTAKGSTEPQLMKGDVILVR